MASRSATARSPAVFFPAYPISSITNGVHAATWVAPQLARLYDRHLPEWRQDNNYLRYAVSIPLQDIRSAHADAKQILLAEVRRRTGMALDPTALTLGFARRATAYKRADLLFTDVERLRRIARETVPSRCSTPGRRTPATKAARR